MPTYEYQCQTCGQRAEAVRTIARRKHGPMCCSQTMEQRIFTGRAFVAPDWNMNYKCVATGQVITSERQRKQILKENDLVDAREFGEPDFEQMREQEKAFKEEAAKPMEVPADLKRAMLREGHGHMLD